MSESPLLIETAPRGREGGRRPIRGKPCRVESIHVHKDGIISEERANRQTSKECLPSFVIHEPGLRRHTDDEAPRQSTRKSCCKCRPFAYFLLLIPRAFFHKLCHALFPCVHVLRNHLCSENMVKRQILKRREMYLLNFPALLRGFLFRRNMSIYRVKKTWLIFVA